MHDTKSSRPLCDTGFLLDATTFFMTTGHYTIVLEEQPHSLAAKPTLNDTRLY